MQTTERHECDLQFVMVHQHTNIYDKNITRRPPIDNSYVLKTAKIIFNFTYYAKSRQ